MVRRVRYSSSYLRRQYKKTKTINTILVAIVIAMAIFIVHEIRNDDDVWNEGFTSCIEENNLYNRYPAYHGDNIWTN